MKKLGLSSASILCMVSALSVNAQEMSKRTGYQIEEVTVTAQKRAQNIQDVPVSVSSFSGDMLRELNMENMNDLSKATPNLKINADGIFNTISIRGLGSGTNRGFEQSVGTFIDDIYYSSTTRLLSAMYDIERIEVLRGPQGSLYGRNTIAGAVAMHTGEVSDEFEASIDSTMGDYDWQKHTLMVNTPLPIDGLALRIAGHYFERSGFVYDRMQDVDSGTTDTASVRAKLRYDISDTQSLTLSSQYQKNNLYGQGDQFHDVPEEWLEFFRGYDPQVEDQLDDYSHSTDYLSGGAVEFLDFSAHHEMRLWGHDITTILAYSRNDQAGGLDADFGPAPAVLGLGEYVVVDRSMEIKLLSDPGKLEYVAGLYYFDSDRDDLTDTYLNADVVAKALAFGLIVGVPTELQNIINAILPTSEITDSERRRAIYTQYTESVAAYGQLTWNIADSWSATFGARISQDQKDLDFDAKHAAAGGGDGPNPIFEQFVGAEEFHIITDRTDKSFTPKFSLIHYVSEDVNIYGTVAAGFKAGGFNASAYNDNGGIEFDQEESTTYELGIKGDYFGGAARLNVGLFRTEFDGLQVTTYDGFDYIVDNAAEAISQGVEIEGMAVLPGGFLSTFNFAYTDAHYEAFERGPCQTQHRSEEIGGADDFCDISGASLAGSPEHQFTVSLNHSSQPFDWPLRLVWGVDYYWQDDVYLQTDLDPEDAQESYSLVNARVGLVDIDDVWSFNVYIKNITDEVVLLSSSDIPLFAGSHAGNIEAPRTVTANISARF